MKPKQQERTPCDDFSRMRLEEILNHRHELYQLAGEIEWLAIEEWFSESVFRGRPARHTDPIDGWLALSEAHF